jgi:drug/metabolite transporter superfamily protein YnfA
VLSGCADLLTEGTADLAGIGGAAAAHSVTRNATVTTAFGLGVTSLALSGLKSEERAVHSAEQDRIAAAAGGLAVDTVGTWSVSHSVPIEDDEAGEVVVSRDIGTPDLHCREIVFSVDTTQNGQPDRAFYSATICLDGHQWRWASAEPATARWGSLQ